ncbi:MAG: dihydrodipicolinate synthase family protein [Mesorhizobium sp.]|nr:MAG: dihydrodipicolinate synthase family protein [Mesorhizobium sp.]
MSTETEGEPTLDDYRKASLCRHRDGWRLQVQIPRLSGILTALATPYDNSGRLDLQALDKLVEYLISNGVHALIPQTLEGRKAVLASVAEIVEDRIPLYVGATSMRPEETVELTKFAEGLGYGAQLLTAPHYSLPGKSELIAQFRNIAKNTSLPMILYNFPARTAWTWTRSSLKASSISRRSWPSRNRTVQSPATSSTWSSILSCNASVVSMTRSWINSYGARAPGSRALPTSCRQNTWPCPVRASRRKTSCWGVS